MEDNQEMVKQLISTAMHVKYKDRTARSKYDILKEAAAIKNALRELYPISAKQAQSLLEYIGSYTACLVSAPRVTERYFVGKHDSGTFPDILLILECEDDAYTVPDGPRTYYEVSLEEFLELADGSLEIRRVRQPLPDWREPLRAAPAPATRYAPNDKAR